MINKYKRLLVIDSNVNRTSPTMRGWVSSFDRISENFDEIEIWAVNCEVATHPKVKWVKCKHWSIAAVESIMFQREVNRKVKSFKVWPPKDTLVQVSGFVVPVAHIRYIQFSNHLFMEERKKRPKYLKLSFLRRLLTERFASVERRILGEQGSTFEWCVVSRKLGETLLKLHNDKGNKSELHIIPNAYNPKVYNPYIREKYRGKMREKYGVSDDEIVFVFTSYAHFERKGLLHAVEAISIARAKGAPFRLIVFGGEEKTIVNFEKQLKKKNISSDGTDFVGLVEDMEQHLSVGEALLFPSHFEAFSLSEIEAAAMGLRLYLTPHYGTEMIMREPTNGKFISWEPKEIANTLLSEWKSGLLGTFHNEIGEALPTEEYERKWSEYYLSMLTDE